MHNSEFDDAYEDKQRISGTLLKARLCELSLRAPLLVQPDTTVVAAVNVMNEERTGCVLVERGGKLVGIFTERDVLTKVIFRDTNRTMTVESVMTKDPECLEENQTVACALNKMSVGGYRHIPIVDRGKPVGVVSIRDLVDFLVELFPQRILNIPPSPAQGIAKSRDGG
jgi:CBS domain-containing protein